MPADGNTLDAADLRAPAVQLEAIAALRGFQSEAVNVAAALEARIPKCLTCLHPLSGASGKSLNIRFGQETDPSQVFAAQPAIRHGNQLSG